MVAVAEGTVVALPPAVDPAARRDRTADVTDDRDTGVRVRGRGRDLGGDRDGEAGHEEQSSGCHAEAAQGGGSAASHAGLATRCYGYRVGSRHRVLGFSWGIADT